MGKLIIFYVRRGIMCTDQQHSEKLDALERIIERQQTLIKGRTPVPFLIMISDTQEWKMEYHGRKHVYFWIPGAPVSLNLGDFGTGPVQNQTWINIAMPEGLPITTSGQATPIEIRVRCTDEVIA